MFAGLIGHLGCRTHILAAHGQIEQTGLAHQRDLRHAYIEADVPLLQIALHTSRRIQAEGAASRQKNGVNSLCRGYGIENL